jgi:hypothetical protein
MKFDSDAGFIIEEIQTTMRVLEEMARTRKMQALLLSRHRPL